LREVTEKERKEELKMKYYAVEFERGPKGYELSEEEFFPIMICLLPELYEMLERYYEEGQSEYIVITNIRTATDEEVKTCTHYYW
jgi:hypothetical protein